MARQDEAGPAEKPNRKPDDSHDRMSDDWMDPPLDTYLQTTPREKFGEHLLNQILTVDLTWATPILAKYCATRGRKPHPPIAMLLALIYQRLMLIPSWRELSTHLKTTGLWSRLGFKNPPSHHAFADFTERVGPAGFQELFKALVRVVKKEILAHNPFLHFAEDVSIDATLVKAWAQDYKPGQKHRKRKGVKKPRRGATDRYAKWGVKGQKGRNKLYVFGYKLHAIVESRLEIPLQFTVSSANRNETIFFKPQLRELMAEGHVVRDSNIHRFYERLKPLCEYMRERSEHAPGVYDLNVVFWLHSEIIGPSVPLAELVFHILNNQDYDPVFDKMLDLFCGTGAVSLAAINAKRARGDRRDKEDDDFTSVPVDIDITVAEQLHHLRHLTTPMARDYRDIDHKFYGQGFDLIAADPPHIIAADFVQDFQEKLSWLAPYPTRLPKLFVIYYGRTYQPCWNTFILQQLKDCNIWEYIYDIRVDKAKLALCLARYTNGELKQFPARERDKIRMLRENIYDIVASDFKACMETEYKYQVIECKRVKPSDS
jgi:hypothetical protein